MLSLIDLLTRYCESHFLVPSSVRTYAAAIDALGMILGRETTTADLTADTLAELMAKLKQADYAPTTMFYYHTRLRSLWRFALSIGEATGDLPPLHSGRDEHRKWLAAKPKNREKPARNYPYNTEPTGHPKIKTLVGPLPPKPVVTLAEITPQTPLLDYYQSVYSRMKLSVRAKGTKRLYINTLRLFAACLGRPPLLADLNDDTVTAHLGWLIETGRQPRTANKSRDQLLAIWRYAARKRHIDHWPDVEQVREYKRVPVAWTLEEMSRILHVARTSGPGGLKNLKQTFLCGVPMPLWWECLLLVLYDTGIRIGAAMQLRCDNFDAANRRLFIPAEIQKQAADQLIPVSEETAAVLDKCIGAVKRDLLFPWSYSLSYLYDHYHRLLKKAGLPIAKRFSAFHKIRKTSATMAELHVGPGAASIHLGHSSPKVTERYLDRTLLPKANVAAALPRPNAAVVASDENNPIISTNTSPNEKGE